MMLQRCKRCCHKTNAMDVLGVSLEDSYDFVYWISKAERLMELVSLWICRKNG